MATVGKDLADRLKEADGYYSDDIRCVEITEYDNAFGGVGYGLTYKGRRNAYTPSEFVRNPRCYWRASDA